MELFDGVSVLTHPRR